MGQFANENGRWVSLRIGFRRFFRESFCFRKLFGTLAILALWLRVAVPRSANDGSPPPLMVAEHGSGAWWRCSPPPLMVAVPGCLLPAPAGLPGRPWVSVCGLPGALSGGLRGQVQYRVRVAACGAPGN